MAVNSKDIEILWKQYSEDAVNKGWDVAWDKDMQPVVIEANLNFRKHSIAF